MSGQSTGGVTYREAEGGYFAKRALRRHAGVWSLWALGVAAVISGEFSGWNLGLDAGGFGGLLVATVIITVMYFGLCYSIAEMSPALPHTGAPTPSRARDGAMGRVHHRRGREHRVHRHAGGGRHLHRRRTCSRLWTICSGCSIAQPIWWLIFYAIFLVLNLIGIEMAMRFTVAICLLALAILAVFFVGALTKFDFTANALNIAPEPGNSTWFPFGVAQGIFLALPFAIWFYLAIEELPLAAEESHDPKRTSPAAPSTACSLSSWPPSGAVPQHRHRARRGGPARPPASHCSTG